MLLREARNELVKGSYVYSEEEGSTVVLQDVPSRNNSLVIAARIHKHN